MKHEHKITILGIYLLLLIIIPKGFNNLFGIIPLRLTLSLVFVLINIYDIIKNKRYNFKGKKYIIFYLLFLLYTIPSLFVAKSFYTFGYTFCKFLVAFLIFLVIINTPFKKSDIKRILVFLLIATLITCVYGLIQYIFDINLFKEGIFSYPGAKGRISSTFFNTIYFGIFLNILIALLTYLLYKICNKKYKLIISLFIVLSYISLLLTFTRSALIIFILSLLGTIVINFKVIFNKYCLVLYTLMITFSLVIPGVKPLYISTYSDVNELLADHLVAKFLPDLSLLEEKVRNGIKEQNGKPNKEEIPNKNETINKDKEEKPGEKVEYTSDDSLNSRIQFSNIGNKLALDYMGTGVGFGGYSAFVNSDEYTNNYPEYAKYKTYPHSALVLLYAEVSICALVFYCLFLISLILKYTISWIKNLKNNSYLKELSALGLEILMGFVVINIIAENAIYDSQIYPIFMVISGVIMSLLVNHSAEKKVNSNE